MERVVLNNKVAVLFSPGHGAGWYSWHNIPELLFDASIVKWVETEERDKIANYLTLKYPNEYFGDLESLSIRWVPVGTRFVINEYDGSESVKCEHEIEWITA